ncbi:MAG: DNA methyltransferase [Candidatus Thorarchaeota archaeon]
MLTPTDSLDESSQGDSLQTLEFVGDIDPLFDIPNQGEILIISNDQSYLTHGIHKFPAKFFPELPRYLIRKYSLPGNTVLDPMCGSGTVVLESLLNDRIGIGIDIDPMAQLITKVKTTPIDPKELLPAARGLIAQINEMNDASDYQPEIPEFHYRDSWFRSYVLLELAIIHDSIDTLTSKLQNDSDRENIRDFFRVVLSSIIRDVSNADSHCTRTVIRKKVVKKIDPGDTLRKFSETLTNQCDSMSELFHISNTLGINEVHLPIKNAFDTGLDSDSIDLSVTSPPYINAVDYPRTHQLEMYWLGLLDGSPLSHVKRKYIGTETVYKKEYATLRTSSYESLDPILEKIYNSDPRRSYIVFKFFEDMKKQLAETYRVLKPGGTYCLTIGSNLIRGVEVRSDQILSEIAVTDIGFELEKSFFSKLIRHYIRIPRPERMLGEWVLVLRK